MKIWGLTTRDILEIGFKIKYEIEKDKEKEEFKQFCLKMSIPYLD